MIGILANQKGGVAKTTNTVHLGASLASQGYKVLLIDFDPQCDLSHNLGIIPGDDHYTVIDLMESKDPFQPEVRAPNLNVVVGSIDFVSNDYTIDTLKNALESHRGSITIKDYFDFILIDCPPSKIVIPKVSRVRNHSEIEIALYCSDFFMIPLKTDDFSVKNANTFLRKATQFIDHYNLNIRFFGFFFSCVLLTENSLEYYTDLFKSNSNDLLLPSFIRQDSEVKRAVQLGKTIFQHKPNCRASKDFTQLTKEFLKLTS